ncbi:glycoside hydrolase family 13 protein [Deinococcus koreensis]|uniref:Glucohydrolase n=1 Tax=Deinococcus koreensis TaxID=2054903 RepID=A0A2K3US32_9DEIO|nr:alpha-glucosidase [Deinococcus koreensis]PNY79310.1 glucohydrolase [Deinococcus koreensis]
MTDQLAPAPLTSRRPRPGEPWWKQSVIYQIYPRSFSDSNGDGIGDLQGIRDRLDYLQTLGVDVLWLCPVYPSPNRDGGYDISDYRGVAPEFGTLDDWKALVADLHARDMRLIMDLVVNHTSDEHPWFQQARASKDSPYRDYYLWRPAREGREPSNWGSHFGGPAWTLDEPSGEYYLHLFSTHQPDLNWDNPRVRAEIHDMMRWWLDLGIDGFRMDTINMLSKPPAFPDAAARAGERFPVASEHFIHGPRLFEYLAEMKAQVLDHYDVMTVGETPDVTPEHGLAFTNAETGPLSMIFAFELMHLDAGHAQTQRKWTKVPWSLAELRQITTRWQAGLHGVGWNSNFLSNHDVPRLVSRFGDDGEFRLASATLLATYLFALQGTPYIYQGDELGLTNVAFSDIGEYRDIDTLNYYREQVNDLGRPPAEVLAEIHAKGRDNARTPMPWTAEPNGGFTSGTPWIALNPTYGQINAQQALADPDSIYWYYRDLIRLRHTYPVFVDGRYDLLLPDHQTVFAFTRTTDDEQLLVLLNFGREVCELDWPGPPPLPTIQLLLANLPGAQPPQSTLTLRPYEARLYHTRTRAGDGLE